jgi:hypothetical protein
MGFSIFVEVINLRVRDGHVNPVSLREPYRTETVDFKPVPVAVNAAARKTKPKSKKK